MTEAKFCLDMRRIVFAKEIIVPPTKIMYHLYARRAALEPADGNSYVRRKMLTKFPAPSRCLL